MSVPSTKLYDQNSFYPGFQKDILKAKRLLVIESPFITKKRLALLLPILRSLKRRGVKIVVNTKPLNEHVGDYQEQVRSCIGMLQEIGVTVLMTIGHHRKIAVIDSNILWEGSLNILSQADSCEIMRRTKSEAYTKDMLTFLRLDRYYDKE